MQSLFSVGHRAATLALALCATPVQSETRLVMAEEPGCIWCTRWNAQIAPIYPKTREGKVAPLRRVDITQPLPDDLAFARIVTFTPTFILTVDGTEVSRLEGYPGEDFFWGLLEQMLNTQEFKFALKHVQ